MKLLPGGQCAPLPICLDHLRLVGAEIGMEIVESGEGVRARGAGHDGVCGRVCGKGCVTLRQGLRHEGIGRRRTFIVQRHEVEINSVPYLELADAAKIVEIDIAYRREAAIVIQALENCVFTIIYGGREDDIPVVRAGVG